jgi:hypothetical protein
MTIAYQRLRCDFNHLMCDVMPAASPTFGNGHFLREHIE